MSEVGPQQVKTLQAALSGYHADVLLSPDRSFSAASPPKGRQAPCAAVQPGSRAAWQSQCAQTKAEWMLVILNGLLVNFWRV